MDNRVKVQIYGNNYCIQGDASPEYVQKLAEFVNEKMEEVGRGIANANLTQIAILAALNIADEYYQLKELRTGLSTELERKTKTLISLLDDGLVGDIYSGYNENTDRM